VCDPLTLTIAATAVAAVGTGVSAVQQSNASNYRAQIDDRNAKLETEAANQENENTRLSALDHYRKVAQLKGQQVAGAAGNGVVTDFGTAADNVSDTDMLANEDVNRIYKQGYQNARSRDIAAWNDRASANANRSAADGALINGAFSVGSTVLNGATQYGKLKSGMGTSYTQRPSTSSIRVTNGSSSAWGF
jgi:hypothetical protein